MKENTNLTELNAVLKGEEMAVESYEKIMKNIEDSYIISELHTIQQDHQSHVDVLTKKIRDLGGDPEKSTGITGLMATTMLSVESRINRNDTVKLLKKVYDGEDKGIAAVEEIIKGDLDQDSMSLVKQILSTDHDHLRTLSNIIAKYEQ